jgi:hypothetical protein
MTIRPATPTRSQADGRDYAFETTLRLRLVILAAVLAVYAGPALAQVLPAPAIGGSTAAFEQVLGGPNDASIAAQLHYQRCAGSDVDQYVVLAPNDQVWTIQRAWCDLVSVPAEQRFADAARFLPPDAEAGPPYITEEGESALTYQSASLGSALPAALFHDCAGNAVPPGTLSIIADGLGGWFMGPGTCA